MLVLYEPNNFLQVNYYPSNVEHTDEVRLLRHLLASFLTCLTSWRCIHLDVLQAHCRLADSSLYDNACISNLCFQNLHAMFECASSPLGQILSLIQQQQCAYYPSK